MKASRRQKCSGRTAPQGIRVGLWKTPRGEDDLPTFRDPHILDAHGEKMDREGWGSDTINHSLPTGTAPLLHHPEALGKGVTGPRRKA